MRDRARMHSLNIGMIESIGQDTRNDATLIRNPKPSLSA